MAKAASSDRVSADMRPTDYRGAVKRMEAIAAKTAKQKAMASEIGDIYEKVAGVCGRSEEHTSELQSLMRISYAVFCLKKKIKLTKAKHRQHKQTDNNQKTMTEYAMKVHIRLQYEYI